MIYTLDQQFSIWSHYFPGFQYKKSFLNPLRSDKNPKCYFKESNNSIYFMDWAYKPTHINCITFVAMLFNTDGKNAISIINRDLKYNEVSKVKMTFNEGIIKKERVEIPSPIIIKPLYEVTTKEFEDYELEYWAQYNINKEILDKYEIKPVKYVYKNNNLDYSASKYNPIFGYYDNNVLYKIYNPIGLKYLKWRTISAILEGYSKLTYDSNVLFVCSSLKDVMTMVSLGYEAFAIPSENSYKILLPVIEELFSKYEHIYIYTDNDQTGVTYSRLLTLEIDTRLKYHNNPSIHSDAKDPSDMIKNYGIDTLKECINQRFKKDNVKLS